LFVFLAVFRFQPISVPSSAHRQKIKAEIYFSRSRCFLHASPWSHGKLLIWLENRKLVLASGSRFLFEFRVTSETESLKITLPTSFVSNPLSFITSTSDIFSEGKGNFANFLCFSENCGINSTFVFVMNIKNYVDFRLFSSGTRAFSAKNKSHLVFLGETGKREKERGREAFNFWSKINFNYLFFSRALIIPVKYASFVIIKSFPGENQQFNELFHPLVMSMVSSN
jgi:hypothetical protein